MRRGSLRPNSPDFGQLTARCGELDLRQTWVGGGPEGPTREAEEPPLGVPCCRRRQWARPS